MPSHLTRYVFRCIIANKPIVHRGCLRQNAYSTLGASGRLSRSINGPYAANAARMSQRRTFFNFNLFGNKKRDTGEADMDPGIDKLMELSKRLRMRARMPPPDEIRSALTRFFAHRAAHGKGIEDTHAQLVVQALRYYRDNVAKEAESTHPSPPRPFQHRETFRDIATALLRTHAPATAHVELAHINFEESKIHRARSLYVEKAARAYIAVLGNAGRGVEALGVALDFEEFAKLAKQSITEGNPSEEDAVREDHEFDAPGVDSNTSKRRFFWSWVATATSKTDDERRLLEVLDIMQTRGHLPYWPVTIDMLNFYLRRGDLDAVKTWYHETWRLHCKQDEHPPQAQSRMGSVLQRVLKWCLANGHVDFGHEVVRLATANNPPKPIWDAIFVWAAGTGKGADEIGRMFTVMESSNHAIPDREQWRVPDITTINCLVEFAISQNDPYLAERFISLGQQRDIQPDARTYVLQMEYRLRVNDVDGTLIAYTNLQSMDLSDKEDAPTVNRLIVALCNSKRHDFDTIMNVAADLSDRRARFEPLTVKNLALLHLRRDEVHDVIDLLNTYAFQYSSSDRDDIRNAIVELALDPKTPVTRSWDAYTVLRGIFDEMPRPQRTAFMVHFFRNERSDMAVNIFTAMRQHSRSDTIPTNDTYATAFVECAKVRDLDSLEVIHNQLKLDYNINIDTHLYNTVIIGYTACEKPRRAMDFWDDIVTSKEGPTYNTIHIVLRACEKAPFGDIKAQEIWQKLRKQKVDLDPAMWASYVAALAGNGDNELVISTVEEADAKNEVEIDAFLLGSALAGCPGQVKQAEIEAWGKEKYPHAWAELEKIGFDVAEDGMKNPRIDRTVTP